MKKAFTYMLIGALTYGAVDMWMSHSDLIAKHIKRMKRSGMDACNKIKAMF